MRSRPVDVVDGAQEVGQAGALGQVVAVGLDGLAQEGHLADAAVGERCHLRATSATGRLRSRPRR